MAQKTMIQAITDALALELEKDENVLIFGEDVGNNGGVFRATEGLQEKFGEDRVFDTPLAESGIGGLAFGLSPGAFGMRGDWIFTCRSPPWLGFWPGILWRFRRTRRGSDVSAFRTVGGRPRPGHSGHLRPGQRQLGL